MVARLNAVDRRMLSLALPTLGALLAPPLFVLTDTAMVGHLGVPQLAGLAVASTVLTTMVGLLVFLAYATTAAVARLLGAGDRMGALRQGVDGMWFAGFVGVASAVGLMLAGEWIVRALGADDVVTPEALLYLYAAAPGIVGMLVTYAATGALRGLSRVWIVLVAAVGGAALNVSLNALLIYGLGLGIAGSGLGTAITETLMAIVLAWAVCREARAVGVALRPAMAGLKVVGRDGLPLFVRTVSLRISIIVTVWAATALGVIELSGHQIVITLWYLAAYALDAIAIAAQMLIGEALGAGKADDARALLRRCVWWGVGLGVLVGALFAVGAPWLPRLFTTDELVRSAATGALYAAAACMPAAGLVFVLDGVLIGAGDGRYLAWTGVVNLATYLPFVIAVGLLTPRPGLLWLWTTYCLTYMCSRAVTLSLRARSSAWLVLGSSVTGGDGDARDERRS